MSEPAIENELSDLSKDDLEDLLKRLKDKMMGALGKNACAHLDMGEEDLYAAEIAKLDKAITKVEFALNNR